MNSEAIALQIRLRNLRDREDDTVRKIGETRDLLAKADARREQDRANASRWNKIVDNLEDSYAALKRERENLQQLVAYTERELSRALSDTGETLSSIDEPPPTDIPPALIEEANVLNTEQAVEDVNDVPLNWRDLLRMSMEELGSLSPAEIERMRAMTTTNRPADMSDMDCKLVESRLQLGSQLSASAAPEEACLLSQAARRRQLVLRAAIDKIQANRTQEISQEEFQALQLCQQRLARKPDPSLADKRLQRIVDAAVNLLRRKRRIQ